MDKITKEEFWKIYNGALESSIVDPFNGILVSYDEDSATLNILKDYLVIYSATASPKEGDSKAKLLSSYIKICVQKCINSK